MRILILQTGKAGAAAFSDLDLVVVAAGDEERLLLVEADAADGALVLVELLEEGAHPVVPQLDHTIVQTKTDFDEVTLEVGIGFYFWVLPGEDPRPLGVEGQSLDPGRLGLELGQHGGGREVTGKR